MRLGFIRILVLALALPAGGGAVAGETFFDDFDVLNRGRWTRSDGWSNGAWMNCIWSRDAARVQDGHLTLSLSAAPDPAEPYRCGEIQSAETYGYGTYEIRLRTGQGSGVNAAFFTYIGPVHDRPHHEIDIEILLRDTSRVSLNTYVDGTPLNGDVAALDTAADAGFNTYAFTWSPEGITWFVNGTEVHRTAPGAELPTEEQRIYASLWSSGTFTDWMGPFEAGALPVEMEIDWIAYTAPGEPCRFPESILCDGP